MKLIFQFIKRNAKFIIISFIIIYHFVLSGLLTHTFKLLPHEFRWLTDVAILLLFVYSLVYRFYYRDKEKFYTIPKVFYLIIIFFAWCTLTAVVNSINFFTVLLQFRDYARFIVFALVVVNLKLSDKDIKLLMFLILGILLLQVPVTAIQYSLRTMGDWCVGTLSKGGTTDLVFLCCVGVSLVISLYVYNKKKLLLLMLVPFFSLPIIFGNIQMGIFLYPYSIILTFLYNFKHNIKLMLLVFAMVFVFITTLFYVVPPFRTTVNRYVSLLGVATHNQFTRKAEGNAPGRMVAPIVALEWISEKDKGWLFGYGFGITKESYWQQTTGRYARKYAPRTNQIATSLMETGFPGIMLYFLLLGSLFVWGNRIAKKFQAFPKSVASVFVCATSLMIIGTIYTNVLTGYYFSFIFWLMFAFLYTLNLNVANEKGRVTLNTKQQAVKNKKYSWPSHSW